MRRLALLALLIAAAAAPRAFAAATFTTLASFDDAHGGYPQVGLAIDGNGNVFGVTDNGGTKFAGVIFQYVPSTHAFNVATNFPTYTGTNGFAWGNSALVSDGAGNLYGTSYNGGATFQGSVFKFNTQTHALTTYASFNGANGANPAVHDAPIFDAAGNLYGTTTGGGAAGAGTLFTIQAGSQNITSLASFNFSNGATPIGRLVRDPNGNLYGATTNGGSMDKGTVFKYDAATQNITTLADFTGVNGNRPFAGLAADAAGNLYGTTSFGGDAGRGNVYKIDATTHLLTNLVSFNITNGSRPDSTLLIDAVGNIFGATLGGGRFNGGTIYKIDAVTHALTTLFNFNPSIDSVFPTGSLVADQFGTLYGLSTNGGPDDLGTIYQLTGAGFATTVPEPGTLSLVALPLVAALKRRPRKSRTHASIHLP